MCKIGEIVVVGGVRRSAMISLSNLQDDKMRTAKSGNWWEARPEMALANNSVAYTQKPDMEAFLKEWTALVESKSGERGIFSRAAAQEHVANHGRREHDHEFGTNPCSEIILRPHQFCNLTEVVVRATDDEASLLRKVKLATILEHDPINLHQHALPSPSVAEEHRGRTPAWCVTYGDNG